MAPLTDAQEKVAILLPVFSGFLSIFGSSLIIFMERRGERKSFSFHRIIVTMSCVDILSSMSLGMSGFFLPPESGRVWAYGNSATCSAVGFFTQVGMATFLYNCCLNLYYCLAVIGGRSEEQISRYWEPWLHIVAIGYPLVTATLGLVLGIYGPPKVGGFLCYADTENNKVLDFIFLVPFVFSMVFLLFSNLAIYWKVRQTSMKNANRFNLSDKVRQRIRDVGIQATFYVAAAYAVTIPDVILMALKVAGKTLDDECTYYWAILLAQWFYPLQGFFNCMTYLRPRYVRFRRKFEAESRWWCFMNAIQSRSTKNPANAPKHAREQHVGMPAGSGKLEPAITSENGQGSSALCPSNDIEANNPSSALTISTYNSLVQSISSFHVPSFVAKSLAKQ